MHPDSLAQHSLTQRFRDSLRTRCWLALTQLSAPRLLQKDNGVRNSFRKAAGVLTPGILLSVICLLTGGLCHAEEKSHRPPPIGSVSLFDLSQNLKDPIRVHPSIYQAKGVSNTFLITTPEGNVVIDTTLAQLAPLHKLALSRVSTAPVKYIILTHGHLDHVGGVGVWKEADTEVIAQQNCVEFLHYQGRLARFFANRNAAQFNLAWLRGTPTGNFGAKIDATITFDKTYEFELGGITFQLQHAPGETHDQLAVWIPQFKAAFVGDNYYRSFPNIYSLRGTKPRWALDYVKSIERVISWKPEILIPSHGEALHGGDNIVEALTRYRDAILYVHDATIRGMNDGKDVFTLMREIKLPEDLDVGEAYGSVAWSVRGIYEGYTGWFDGNPSHMYSEPASEAYPEIVRMAGGPDAVAARAQQLIADGQSVRGLHLAEMALTADADHTMALEARLAAFEALEAKCTNAIEHGWLRYGIRMTQKRLGK